MISYLSLLPTSAERRQQIIQVIAKCGGCLGFLWLGRAEDQLLGKSLGRGEVV